MFWRERLAEGTGGTCFARVAAFEALVTALGFPVRKALGRVLEDGDHAALFVEASGREWLCDVGFPLPALLPAREGTTETGMGPLRVEKTSRGFSIAFEEGVPESPRRLEVFEISANETDFAARWEGSFRAGSKFMRGVYFRRQLEARAVSFASGEIRVDDRHSRTRIPLEAGRAAALEDQFGTSRDAIEEAFATVGDPDPGIASAEVRVYLESPADAGRAWAAIASAEAYARLHEGVAGSAAQPTGPRAWRLSLEPDAGGAAVDARAVAIVEDVEAHDASRTLEVVRKGMRSAWQVEEKDGSVYLVRRAELAGPRLDLLRNDSLRGRLAGSLAVDLLGWTRRIGAGS